MTSVRDRFRESVVYQIYPRSYNDADGDGIGDIRGIIDKLDYLDELGVDVVWLNPVYDSPLADNGYDVRNYREILDEYGSLADWEELRDGLHERDIRLLMDLVLNHTSDEHEWFRRSRRGEDGYRDYYIWRSGDGDQPPNNWTSFFGGSAWTYDEQREAYYLHLFDEMQPDLNWQNPRVREEMHDVMRFWLEKGADGFRIDVVNVISKPEALPDGDPDARLVGAEHFITGPRVHEYVREFCEEALAPHDAVTVGETYDVTPDAARRFVEDGLDMVFPFDHVKIDEGDAGPWDIVDWDVTDLQAVTERWQHALPAAWIGLYLTNHDQPRAVSRFGDEAYRYESATMLATFLFTLRGTPFVYQGAEIGMTNVPFESLAEYRDVATVEKAQRAIQSGEFSAFEEISEVVNYWSRDNARTPMQWSDDPNGGFTDGTPWIKLNPNYTEINVRAERTAERSVLRYYQSLIELRHTVSTLVYGEYVPLLEGHSEILAYLRVLDDETVLVVLNFSGGEPTFALPAALESDFDADLDSLCNQDGSADVDTDAPSRLLGNYEPHADADPVTMDLRPYEAQVYRLS